VYFVAEGDARKQCNARIHHRFAVWIACSIFFYLPDLTPEGSRENTWLDANLSNAP
jgi:hypothetical protein